MAACEADASFQPISGNHETALDRSSSSERGHVVSGTIELEDGGFSAGIACSARDCDIQRSRRSTERNGRDRLIRRSQIAVVSLANC